MQKLTIITFILICNLIFGQEFNLSEPNIQKLKEQISVKNSYEVIYSYLTNNYKTTSKKYDLEYYEWDDSKLCAFTQEFENGIKYSVFECKEAGGLSIDMELPKIARNKLMKWIEGIYEVDKMTTDKYIWKEDNSKFEPVEIIPGCYFKIEEKENTTLIDLYCGC